MKDSGKYKFKKRKRVKKNISVWRKKKNITKAKYTIKLPVNEKQKINDNDGPTV